MNGIKGNDQEKNIASEYIGYEVRRQESAGAHYLDINVDEIHYDLKIQKQAMEWAVSTVESYSSIPLCIDSSNSDIIQTGLSEYKGKNGPPIINSYALERPEVLDMLKEYGGKVITMAASDTSMPQNTEERIENANIVIDNLLKIGIPLNDIFLDAIIFPISVDTQNGNHYLNAVIKLRDIYGPELYIGMGLSNVSFGMPKRKLINLAFIYLCIQAGVNAGITDPIQTKVNDALKLNPKSYPIKYAIDMLLGKDDFCLNYISAFRDGRL
jgi:5-methyltetrahydrofolate--homocysteine methyltransferase